MVGSLYSQEALARAKQNIVAHHFLPRGSDAHRMPRTNIKPLAVAPWLNLQ